MTLTTKVLVHEPTNAEQLLGWMNEQLLSRPNAQQHRREGWIGNVPGQGLAALVDVHWSASGAPFDWTSDWYYERADYDSDDGFARALANLPAGYVLLTMDTPYGGRPAETHAALIAGLHLGYLEPRGLNFAWNDEYRDEWHEGLSGFEAWFGAQDGAESWFHSFVAPALGLQR